MFRTSFGSSNAKKNLRSKESTTKEDEKEKHRKLGTQSKLFQQPWYLKGEKLRLEMPVTRFFGCLLVTRSDWLMGITSLFRCDSITSRPRCGRDVHTIKKKKKTSGIVNVQEIDKIVMIDTLCSPVNRFFSHAQSVFVQR